MMGSGASTVVEYLTTNPGILGSNPVAAWNQGQTGKEKVFPMKSF
jgi:hypothetical protein